MKIHEYQAFDLFERYGVETPERRLVRNPEEAAAAARELVGGPYMVKAQVHSGGRGKAGGVMIGSTLVTRQTGPQGKIIRRVLVTRAVKIQREFYLSLAIDPEAARVVLLASAQGGVEIEQLAAESPEKIIQMPIDPYLGLQNYQARDVAVRLGLGKELYGSFVGIASGLYRLFLEKDCSLVEINPLALTDDGRLVAADAKINFDQNALMRHKDILALRDVGQEDPREAEASNFGLSYIALSGDIGCMVNGAGLAMATMDIIRHCGGSPANFLDVGGGATSEKVAGAFKILLSDGSVRGILINIFGGIMQCDVIARGIVEAAGRTTIGIPIVVRLEGTHAEEGKKILAESGLDITPAESMAQAARKIVAAAKAPGWGDHR